MREHEMRSNPCIIGGKIPFDPNICMMSVKNQSVGGRKFIMRIAETRQKVYIKMRFLIQKFEKTEEKESLSGDERKIHFRRGFLSSIVSSAVSLG